MTTNTEAQQGGELPQDERAALNTFVFAMDDTRNCLDTDDAKLRQYAVKRLLEAEKVARAALAQRAASVPAQELNAAERTMKFREIDCDMGKLTVGANVNIPAASVPDAGRGILMPEKPTPDIEDAMSQWLHDYLGMDASITQFGRLYRAILAAAAPQATEKP